MRRLRQTWWLVAAMLAVALPRRSFAQRTASVDCSAARLDLAERDVCASPDLIRLAAMIDRSTRRLEGQLTGVHREALMDTEHPFVVQRNACQNESGAVHACVARVMSARARALASASATPPAIDSEVVRYQFVDLAYVERWGSALVGRTLEVWGCLSSMRARSATSTASLAVTSTCTRGAEPILPVQPAALSDADSTFVRAGPRVGYWRGTLERIDGAYRLAGWRP